MRIISATNRKAISRLLERDRRADRATDRRARAIVDQVRGGADRALVRFARRFDRATPPLEVPIEEIRGAAARVPAEVREAIRRAVRAIARVAFQQIPELEQLNLQLKLGYPPSEPPAFSVFGCFKQLPVPMAAGLMLTAGGIGLLTLVKAARSSPVIPPSGLAPDHDASTDARV